MLVQLADRALMQAKTDGRDCVVIWDSSLRKEPAITGVEPDALEAATIVG